MTQADQSLGYRDKAIGYDALSHRRRRSVIRALDETDAPLTLMELATTIAEWDDEASTGDDSELVRDVYTTLYHAHVPKLADAGFVRYNKDEQKVSLSEAAPVELAEQLED